MALKPWHQWGLLATSLGLVAVVALPSRPIPAESESSQFSRMFGNDYNYYDGAKHRWTLDQTVSRWREQAAAEQAAAWVRAQSAGTHVLRGGGGALNLVYEAPLTADSARVWLRMLEAELALVPRGDGHGMPVTVAMRPLPAESISEYRTWQVRTITPPGSSGCIALVRFPPRGTVSRRSGVVVVDGLGRRTNVMDWCLGYARFGTPGAAVARWMGITDARQAGYYGYGATLAAFLAQQRSPKHVGRRDDPEFWYDVIYSLVYGEACRRSGGEACLRHVGITEPGRSRAGAGFGAARSLAAALMFSDPDRFGRFWRSDDAPQEALRQAFGRPASETIRGWAMGSSSQPVAAESTARVLLASLGWVVLVVGTGLVVAGRRQVS